jgi:hypothetical protein
MYELNKQTNKLELYIVKKKKKIQSQFTWRALINRKHVYENSSASFYLETRSRHESNILIKSKNEEISYVTSTLIKIERL